jgi:D-serine deaminase-like pyridoxal phosphate-dependent protein
MHTETGYRPEPDDEFAMYVVSDVPDTPTVVVDEVVLERNITTWAAQMQQRGVGLRPHTKTSKCLEVIARQVRAGVVGLTVATLGEAEVLANAGYQDLFMAYPLWAGQPTKAHRVRELNERTRLTVAVESVEAAAALGTAVRGSQQPLRVLVELDPGLARSGVKPADAVRIARACEDAGLDVRGAFTYGGHGYAGCGANGPAADDEVRVLTEAKDALVAAGFNPVELSAGSTPTARLSARPPVTDERPGTYVFSDAQQVQLGVTALADVALWVAATVVASHLDGRFVLDCGSKVLSSDRPAWANGYGLVMGYPDAVIESLSEHHGVARTIGPRPRVGEIVAVIPNHCCAVVNLTDELMVIRDGRAVDVWAVVSRGRNR